MQNPQKRKLESLLARNIPHDPTLLKIKEVDDAGDTILLKSNYRVVDPNSTIIVAIDNPALAGKLAGSELSPAITSRLMQLKEMLQAEQQAMQNVTEAIQPSIMGQDPNSPAWQVPMKKLHDFVRLIVLDKDALQVYQSLLPQNPSLFEQYQTLFKTAAALGQHRSRMRSPPKQRPMEYMFN